VHRLRWKAAYREEGSEPAESGGPKLYSQSAVFLCGSVLVGAVRSVGRLHRRDVKENAVRFTLA
jgi:hypothetical protein